VRTCAVSMSCVHSAQLERLFDDTATRLEHRRIEIEFIELCVAIGEVADSSCRTADIYVIICRPRYCLVIGMGKVQQSCWRHRSLDHNKTVGLQSLYRFRRKLRLH
jgi:hypothetical protein